MSTNDKNRYRKTYSFFRPTPIFASGGGGGGGGGSGDQFWYSTTNDSIYTTGSVAVRGNDVTLDSPLDKGTDVFFYVSGSAFTADDLSLFGGDLLVSGSIISFGDLIEVTGSIIATEGISGSLTTLADGTSYLIAGNNISITSASNGSVKISSTGGGDSFFLSTTNKSIFTTGSVAIRGGESAVDSPADKGTDVFFYVSGSILGVGTDNKKALFGGDVKISGSLSQGFLTEASNLYSHAEGAQTIASGYASHAEGNGSTASGDQSHAEGDTTTASGIGSHAEGYDSTASGDYAHAQNASTLASGISSHAEGDGSTASGTSAHAEGVGTVALGYASHAAGQNTIASGSAQTVVGRYNLRSNTNSLFVVGNGTGNSDANRSDVLRVNPGALSNGRVEITGSLASTIGLSGSLTTLVDGRSYLVAGPNTLITSASNGQVTISGSETLQFLAGVVSSGAASGSMESIGMAYLDQSALPVGNKSYIFKAILAKTAGTTAYVDLYDYNGIITGTPGPIASSVLTGSSESYTYLTANLTSQFSSVTSSGIIEARIWCTPNGSGLATICKSAKLDIK